MNTTLNIQLELTMDPIPSDTRWECKAIRHIHRRDTNGQDYVARASGETMDDAVSTAIHRLLVLLVDERKRMDGVVATAIHQLKHHDH